MDMTGLDGKYDVSLETAPPSIVEIPAWKNPALQYSSA
jgi:hypothetical protein